MGVNRLSLGVQSFDDAELRWLGRIHTAAEAEAAFAAARAAGLANVSLDFIYGLPGQDPVAWARTLARAISLAPEHLSLYSLTVEHGTPLADQVRRGLVPAPDDDLAADLYDLACDALAAGGYEQYEISNWARAADGRWQMADGEWQIARPSSAIGHRLSAIGFQLPASSFQCHHNLVYWRREPYLGFGAGAHSFTGERRWWNVRPVPAYIQRIGAGQSPEEGSETIDPRLAMGETMMLGLRLVQEGVTDARFQERFGVGLEEAFGREIRRLVARGLLERLPDRVRLTPAARLVGNRVFAEFLP
jgi:oxygen-independent coproporphyrinogen-3 oxidase